MSRKRKKKNHSQTPADSQAAARIAFDRRIGQAFHRVENLVVQRAADLAPSPVQWLWPDRIARGQLTLLAGDSGVGKSLLAIDLAARVSTGARWPDRPDEEQAPGNVLIITAHDDPAAIGRARLEKAGADLSRVFFVSGPPRDPNRDLKNEGPAPATRQINVADDVMALLKLILFLRPIKLVVIDPAWIFCGRGTGRSRNAGPAILAELAGMAAQTQVALVCVTDVRHDGRAEAGYRPVGERALLAAAPTVWGIRPDPRSKSKQRLLLPLKSNNTAEQPALTFRIDDGRLVWNSQPVAISGAEVLAAEKSNGRTWRATAWLEDFLSAGPRPQKEVMSEGKEYGFSDWMLRQSKESLGAHHEKVKCDEKMQSMWMLEADWQVFLETGVLVRLRPQIAAAAEEFERGCGVTAEPDEERGRRGEEETGRRGEEPTCEEAESIGRNRLLDVCASPKEAGVSCGDLSIDVESDNWDRESPPLPPLTKGGIDGRAAHIEARILDEIASSSKSCDDFGGFCQDEELAGACGERGENREERVDRREEDGGGRDERSTGVESDNWDRESPPLPPLTKGGSEGRVALAEAHVLNKSASSSKPCDEFGVIWQDDE